MTVGRGQKKRTYSVALRENTEIALRPAVPRAGPKPLSACLVRLSGHFGLKKRMNAGYGKEKPA
jgi:hypothetical protein